MQSCSALDADSRFPEGKHQNRSKEHQGLVPVPLIIAKRLNFLKGRQPRNPSQTNGYLIF